MATLALTVPLPTAAACCHHPLPALPLLPPLFPSCCLPARPPPLIATVTHCSRYSLISLCPQIGADAPALINAGASGAPLACCSLLAAAFSGRGRCRPPFTLASRVFLSSQLLASASLFSVIFTCFFSMVQ